MHSISEHAFARKVQIKKEKKSERFSFSKVN